MTHARTLPRYVGAAGLVAGLLVAVPSLSHGQGFPPGHPYHIDTARARIMQKYATSAVERMGERQIEVNARVRHSNLPGGVTRYTQVGTYIPASKVRVGALSALGRGVMHPGFYVAILAAGYYWNQQHGIHTLESAPVEGLPDGIGYDYGIPPEGYRVHLSSQGTSHPSAGTAFAHYASVANTRFVNVYCFSQAALPDGSTYCGQYRALLWTGGTVSAHVLTGSSSTPIPDSPLEPAPVSESELPSLDSHIPPELVDQLWNGEPIPEWQDEITVLGLDNITSEGPTTEELIRAARAQNENLYAQLSGESEPNPDTPTIGGTASDEMLEQWQQPIPPFPDTEAEWQVETIEELPAYDIGIGSGQCPPPTVITLPFPLNSTLTLNWQPFCDLASMIRGAVIAVAMILSLYIVLRRG